MQAYKLLASTAALALGTLALAFPLASPALAQNIDSTSGSNAAANSGSISGAQSNGNQQAQGQTANANNAGIGTSASESNSASGAISGSNSTSGSNSDQGQAQGQDQGQSQGQTSSAAQTQGLTNTNQLGATNQQGTTVSNTFNSTTQKRTYLSTNTAVPLAASSSFSSDYCGGTVSGGASIAPIGVSLGASGPKMDNSCRYLRLGEKAGMLAANYHNMGQHEMAMKAMSLMSWAVCMAGPQQDKRSDVKNNNVMDACSTLGLLGGGDVSAAPPPAPPPVYVRPVPEQPPVSPLDTQKPNTEPPTPTTTPPAANNETPAKATRG